MNLGDMENAALSLLQQPGANFTTGKPDWAMLTNPQFGQGLVDFFLNRAYERIMGDLADLRLFLVTGQAPSVAYQPDYAISAFATFTTYATGPVTNNTTGFVPAPIGGAAPVQGAFPSPAPATIQAPPCKLLHRVIYASQGLNYAYEYEPGQQLVSWTEFQRLTGWGYLRNTAFATLPTYVAMSQDRKYLSFFYGPSAANDTITIQYAPLPAAGTSVPFLAAATDAPVIPEDCHQPIVDLALYYLWQKGREMVKSRESLEAYNAGVAQIRKSYLLSSVGETMRFKGTDGGTFSGVGMGDRYLG